MTTREYRTMDKAAWGAGAWQAEPDKLQWIDQATGLDCLIVRNHLGALCGYVGVPGSHPWYGSDYDDVDADVHGGLTYAAPCQVGPEDTAICHVPFDGSDDAAWWLGFDCAHGGDLVPGMLSRSSPRYTAWAYAHDTYRDVAYVQAECARLAAQIAANGLTA